MHAFIYTATTRSIQRCILARERGIGRRELPNTTSPRPVSFCVCEADALQCGLCGRCANASPVFTVHPTARKLNVFHASKWRNGHTIDLFLQGGQSRKLFALIKTHGHWRRTRVSASSVPCKLGDIIRAHSSKICVNPLGMIRVPRPTV